MDIVEGFSSPTLKKLGITNVDPGAERTSDAIEDVLDEVDEEITTAAQ